MKNENKALLKKIHQLEKQHRKDVKIILVQAKLIALNLDLDNTIFALSEKFNIPSRSGNIQGKKQGMQD
jgi:hypothetical protein